VEEVGAFVWQGAIEQRADTFDERVDGARGLLP
jgi:hypothetical protein